MNGNKLVLVLVAGARVVGLGMGSEGESGIGMLMSLLRFVNNRGRVVGQGVVRESVVVWSGVPWQATECRVRCCRMWRHAVVGVPHRYGLDVRRITME
jgi:hypothetical protein